MKSENKMMLRMTVVNDSENYVFGVDEQECELDTLNDLYKHIRSTSKGKITKMYIGEHIHVGYVLTSREQYDDCKDTYLRSTWFELLRPVKVMREVVEYESVA